MLSLDYTIIYTIINIIVLFLLLKKFLFKPVTEIMEKRQQDIENSISIAKEKEESAIELQQKYENELKLSKIKAEELISTAKNKAQIEYEKIVNEASYEAQKVTQIATNNIEILKKKEMERLQESIVDIALAVAIKASEESIDQQKSKKMLDELVMKAGA